MSKLSPILVKKIQHQNIFILYENFVVIFYSVLIGECSVFDNLRVLHGRRGYKLEEGGHRHLKGCYMDWDEIHSKMNVLLEKFNGRNRAY